MRSTLPIVWKVLSCGEPVRVRPETMETIPCHHDMLRYDTGFHHPRDPWLVILPIFKGKHGLTQQTLTMGRWRSFGLTIQPLPEYDEYAGGSPFVDWITYRSEQNPEPLTLTQFIVEHQKGDRNFQIVRYR